MSTGIAENDIEIVAADGDAHNAERAESACEIDDRCGPLRNLTAAWEEVQRTRLALDQREFGAMRHTAAILIAMKGIEDQFGRQIRRAMEAHPVWPWLSQYPGLGGVHVARLLALIDDPHRFPGRLCAAGHHHSAAVVTRESDIGAGCGYKLADGTVCAASVGELRRGTGTRSLWHYLGLHVVDGRAPRKRKGQRADWNPKGRTAILMPGGIAEQIVRLRVPVYRDIYDVTKARLTSERAVHELEIDAIAGSLAPLEGPHAEIWNVTDSGPGLRPFQIDAIARKIAAKAFVADLLQAMKRVM